MVCIILVIIMKDIHGAVISVMGVKESMRETVGLCRQVELEWKAMWLAPYGYATIAFHAIIEQKDNALGKYLEQLVGKEAANSIVVQTYMKVVD